MSQPLAILCSDLHLSHRAPVSRSCEPSWYQAMQRPLDELRELAEKLKVPIICAGDVFDRWNSPPELINFAIRYVPEMFAVPGQHDLPDHSLREITRSAFWTLVQCGNLISMPHGLGCTGWQCEEFCLKMYPFPWGVDLESCHDHSQAVKIAVVHRYCWVGAFKYSQAPDSARLSEYEKALKGYDILVFGDNHKGFVQRNICNCGGFMRRTIDERDRKPFVGILKDDLTIEQHFLDTSMDRMLEPEELAATLESTLDLTDFVEELKDLKSGTLDFRQAVYEYMNRNEIPQRTRVEVLTAIGD